MLATWRTKKGQGVAGKSILNYFFKIEIAIGIEIDSLISAGDAVFLSTSQPEAIDPVKADGRRSGG